MSSRGSEARPAPRALAPPPDSRASHPRSFKLRFAPVREPGRSYLSAVKPRALPATVTDKFYALRRDDVEPDATAAVRRRVDDMFAKGPRERLPAPMLTSHEYGWWCERAGAGAPRADRRLQHHVRDSPWLKERLRILAADNTR